MDQIMSKTQFRPKVEIEPYNLSKTQFRPKVEIEPYNSKLTLGRWTLSI